MAPLDTDLLQPVVTVIQRSAHRTTVLLACGHEQTRERYLARGYSLACRECKTNRLAANRDA